MAILYFVGWETGDLGGETITGSGASVQSTTKRTGTYALRANPASSAAAFRAVGTNLADGSINNSARAAAETFYCLWFRFASIPSGTTNFIQVTDGSGNALVSLKVDSSGNITITGTTTSATIATVTAGTWNRADIRATRNATSGAKINGSAELTVTASDFSQQQLRCGRGTTEAVAMDCFYDDIVMADAAITTGPLGVLMKLPTGDGTYTAWASGTGTTFAEVDEVTNDGDTTYVKALDTGDNTARTFTGQSLATLGIGGAVAAVKAYIFARSESTTGTSTVALRFRSGSTNNETTGVEWGTTYAARSKVYVTDPNTSAAWTHSAVDASEVGCTAATIAQAQRMTQACWMILYEQNINADVPAGLLDFVAVAPGSAKSAAVASGLVEFTTPGLVESQVADVPVGLIKFSGVTPGTAKSAAVPIGLLELLGVEAGTAKSAAVAAVVVEFVGLEAGTGGQTVTLDPVVVELLGVTAGTAKSAAVAAVGFELLGVAAGTAKSAAVPPAAFELLGVEAGTAKSAAVPPAGIDLVGVAPDSAKSAAVPPVVLELVGLEAAATRQADVPPGLLQFVVLAATIPAQVAIATRCTLRRRGPTAELRRRGLTSTLRRRGALMTTLARRGLTSTLRRRGLTSTLALRSS